MSAMDRHWKRILPRIALLALVGAILLVAVWRETPCMIRQLTGVICPTCGMSRAWLACFRLEFRAAFFYHPMFWSIPVLALAFLLDGYAFPGKKATHVIYWVTLLGFALTWVIRILCSLHGIQTV
jgi:hypothetical protein